MRHKIALIFLFALCYQLAFAQKSQLAIFVYNCNSTTPINALRSQLTTSFIEGGNSGYNIVDRTDEILNILKAEYQYQGSGMVKDDNIISAGEHLGANFICVIAITKYPEPDGYFFESKIVDVAKRQIIKNAFYPQKNQEAVNSLRVQEQLKVADDLAKQLNLFSFIELVKQEDLKNIGDFETYKIKNIESTTDGNYHVTLSIKTINGQIIHSRIGHIDKSGKHGFKFYVINQNSLRPDSSTPTLSELQLLYNNRLDLGLSGEYWSKDNAKHNRNAWDYYYTLDFDTGKTNIRRVSNNKGYIKLEVEYF